MAKGSARQASRQKSRGQQPKQTRPGARTRQTRRNAEMVFSRRNYQLLLLGVAVVVVGYVIMRLDNQVEGFLSLYLAPLLILGGYLEIVYAILWRPKDDATEAAEPA